MSSILVTGGGGFIGSHTSEALLKKHYRVRVFDNFSTGTKENLAQVKKKVQIVHGDICNIGELEEAMQGVTYVIHLAALVSVPESLKNPEKCYAINVDGTKNVLETALRNKVKKVILASSAAVYGNMKPPLKETYEGTLLSPYGKSKLLMEREALRYHSEFGLPVVCLRYFNVYGPRQISGSPYSGVISKFIEAFQKNKSPVIYGDGEQTRDFIYVQDVVDAMLLTLKNNITSGEILNLATGKPTSINALLAILQELFRQNTPASYQAARPGDITYSFADIGKIQKTIGFSPNYTLKQGLKKTIEWFKHP